MNFDEYDGCLCGGVPAVCPRPPRWPTDQAFESALTASLPGDLGKVFTPWILESYKRQRMMDIAWVHFNHLRDKYAADGILRTIPEWVELLCVPSGWDGEALLQSGRGGPDPLQVLRDRAHRAGCRRGLARAARRTLPFCTGTGWRWHPTPRASAAVRSRESAITAKRPPSQSAGCAARRAARERAC